MKTILVTGATGNQGGKWLCNTGDINCLKEKAGDKIARQQAL